MNSENIILIKFDHPGEFVEGDQYILHFDYTKSIVVPYTQAPVTVLTQYPEDKVQRFEECLMLLDGHNITMTYKGISAVDGMCLFTIDFVKNNRNNKLDELLND